MGKVCLTFDVEERFHSHLSVPGAKRQYRAGDTVLRLVDWLIERECRATFFVVGEVAEQCPAAIRRVAEAGFEVASHSHTHLRLDRADRRTVRADIARSKQVLEGIVGHAVKGFRAPSWSAHRHDGQFWDDLLDMGFVYDSSLFPVATPMYGSFANPMRPWWVAPGLLEIPPSALGFGPVRLPFGGGFYFRAWPLVLTQAFIAAAPKLGIVPVLYFHPWELEPTSDNIDDGRLKAFIANHGVAATWDRFATVVAQHDTTSMVALWSAQKGDR